MMSLPTIPDLIKRSWQQYKEQSGVLLKVALAYFVVENIQSITNLSGLANQPWTGIVDQALFFLGLFLNSWLSVVIIRQVASGAKQLEKNVFSTAFDQAWPYFLFTVFILSAFFGGLFLFILPGLLILFWTSFVEFPLILEGKGIMESIYASRNYFRGRGWLLFNRIFVVYAPYFLMFLLPFIAVRFPIGNTLVTDLSRSLILTLFMPFETIYIYLLYRQIKEETPTSTSASGKYKTMLILSGIVGFSLLVLVTIASIANWQ